MPLMNALLSLSLVAALAAAPIYADCPPPNDAIKIPDGATATKDQMLAAQHAIKDADAAIAAFADCLRDEQDAKIAAGGDKMKDAEKLKISAEYVNRQNVEVEKLQKLADQFNVELHAYKAKVAPPPAPAAP
jgi:hypothetical protein